ncbi:MAG TPA: hypothetical protein VII75_11990 [Thermoanaerobaculia bacterium]
MQKALTVVLVLAALPLFANPGAVGVVLVPISPGTVAGANGAQWTTTLWMHNADFGDVTIYGDTDSVIAPNVTMQLGVPYANLGHPGFFLITAQQFGGIFTTPGDVWLTLRTLDSASAFHTAGTEIPLPGFGDFSAGKIVFPSVPANGHSRIKLRIYSTQNSTVTVRTYDGNAQLASKTAGLIGRSTTGDLTSGFVELGTVPRIPAYGELDIASGTVNPNLRVEIDATQPTWGFISITDDATHEFTIVQPHQPSLFITSLF